jgi:hypothetical protein
VIAAVVLAAAASLDACTLPTTRDAADWKSIAPSDAVFLELDALFASRDPDVRDGVGFETVVAWVYRERKVSDAALAAATARWRDHLRCGLGATGDDRVFLRSFSALALSIAAAADLKQPWRDKAAFDGDLDAALAYLAGEKDLRGWVDGAGWAHAVAHTADWLKFLGRSPHLAPAQAARILEGIAAKLETTTEPFVRAEPERLAAAVVSLARRKDFDVAAFASWANRLAALEAAVWKATPFDPARHAAALNAKAALLSLYVGLDLSGATEEAKAALAEALKR